MGDQRCRPRAGAAAFLVLLGSCVAREAAPERFEFDAPKMGTNFRIVLYANGRDQAQRAARAAFARIDELEAIFSDYDPTSEAERLSRQSDACAPTPALAVSRELLDVLCFAQELARETCGAFDVTVGPLTRLHRQARRRGELPSPERVDEAAAAVGYAALELDHAAGTLRFLVPAMRLDFGALAKGLAVDEALEVLRVQGVESALVVGGGDIAAGDAPPNRSGWRIELARFLADGPPAVLELEQEALATSGDLERFVELDGVRHSHILDARTGVPLTERRLVTVIAKNCLTADALATAISVIGEEEGLSLARAYEAEFRVATLQGEEVELRSTAGFPRALSSLP